MGLLVWGLFYLTYVTAFVLYFCPLHSEMRIFVCFKDVIYFLSNNRHRFPFGINCLTSFTRHLFFCFSFYLGPISQLGNSLSLLMLFAVLMETKYYQLATS